MGRLNDTHVYEYKLQYCNKSTTNIKLLSQYGTVLVDSGSIRILICNFTNSGLYLIQYKYIFKKRPITFIYCSTLSSGLSSLSALLWTDLIKPHTKPISEFKATVISKCSGKSLLNAKSNTYANEETTNLL